MTENDIHVHTTEHLIFFSFRVCQTDVLEIFLELTKWTNTDSYQPGAVIEMFDQIKNKRFSSDINNQISILFMCINGAKTLTCSHVFNSIFFKNKIQLNEPQKTRFRFLYI